jgi:hypothetical protein
MSSRSRRRTAAESTYRANDDPRRLTPQRGILAGRRTPAVGRIPDQRSTPPDVSAPCPIARTDRHRWSTMNTERTVLVGVHTPTSLLRLEDITLLLEDDLRIQLIYTQVPDHLGNGVAQKLQQLEVRTIPWQEAVCRTFDLTISASLHQMGEVGAVRRFTAPHGAGYNKLWPSWATDESGERQVYGLDRRSLLGEDNQPIFDAIVLPHHDHVATLTRQCPEAVAAAIIAGDPCYDRLCASLGAKDKYRSRLGVRDAQVLVAVSSTWGQRSLLGSQRDLLLRLTSELPVTHRVIATLHPAVWSEHGSRQVRTWLRDARAAGIDLIDAGEDWRALVAAADVMIADHSSLAVYASSVKVPLLLSHFAHDDVDPHSVMAELADRSPRLCPSTPLLEQLQNARRAQPAQWDVSCRRISTVKGQSAAILRQKLYQLLDLSEPSTGANWPLVPVPRLVRDVVDLH